MPTSVTSEPNRVVLRARRGPAVVWTLAVANLLAWVAFGPGDDGRSGFARQVLAESLSSTAVVLFAAALVLATRLRWLEPWFGGLDKMYRTHRHAATAGFVLLVGHVALVPWRLDSPGGVPAGIISFVGLSVLVVLSLGPRLRGVRRVVTLGYGPWRRTHRLIGVFFVFSLAHMFLVRPLVVRSAVLTVVVMAAYVLGIASYVYGLVIARWVRPILRYDVAKVRPVTADTTEVALRPRGRPLGFTSGQFVFVRFRVKGLREPHPFTVASSPNDQLLRLVIRTSGDFTRRLAATLEPGCEARIEGAYGMLDPRRGGREQVWVAGGIGITPVMSWLRGFGTSPEDADREVDVFYTARSQEQAVYAEELAAAASRHPTVRFHLTISSRDGSLTVAQIAEAVTGHLQDKDVYMCGPARMLTAFQDDLLGSGLRRDQIHYEEFSFR